MTSQEIRERFLKFFEERGHKVVPSSSLIPDDPSVLFTTAGMQQFKPYYTGEADAMRDFGSLNTASIQKSMRTSDIDEVGDESHLTFFEMLGNFSFGGYFKKDAIKWAHEFITSKNWMGLEIDYVSVFGGENEMPKDTESEKIWKSIDPNIKIKYAGKADNFWGPTGKEGPCGPTTEIYVNGLEIWNIVFNEFYCKADGSLEPLKTPGIDTGMGLERLAMAVQKKKNIFETDLFETLFKIMPNLLPKREKRILADHIRASAFLLADGIHPSNKEGGYILRRLMRRVFVYEMKTPQGMFDKILEALVQHYGPFYKELEKEKSSIFDGFEKEREKFILTLSKGIKELNSAKKRGPISAADAFRIYETFGLPYEAIKDWGGKSTENLRREDFELEFAKHQEISKAGQEKKFGGHGLILDTGELKAGSEEELKKVTCLHTATHLLQTALREVLGPEVKQMGSDITPERTRFDFSFGRKLTPEELKKVEALVNKMISRDLNVKMKEMDYEDAVKSGALSFFKHKYPKRVKVYSIGEEGREISKEFCGGPHVKRTGEVGRFKIIKEEAVAAGTRRIRAAVDFE